MVQILSKFVKIWLLFFSILVQTRKQTKNTNLSDNLCIKLTQVNDKVSKDSDVNDA